MVGEVRDETGLAETSLTGHQDDTGEPRRHVLPTRQRGQNVLVPPHHREPAVTQHGARHRSSVRCGPCVDDPDDGHRVVQPLQDPFADRLELGIDAAGAEASDQVGAPHLSRSRESLETCRLDDCDAVDVVVVEADLANGQPDPEGEVGDGTGRPRVTRHGALDVERSGHRCRRRREICLHAVAGPAENPSLVRSDAPGEEVVVVAAKLIGTVLAEARPLLGRAHHVGEQNRPK